ncbi:MAG: hypothetical protein IJT34_09240 [Butyrivibrio sp.]|nr:hypothetical protein [Butyrivibrio sp.]
MVEMAGSLTERLKAATVPEQTDPDQDFKYVMQDASRYYFGARLSYHALSAHEFTPFKFKTIIGRYLVRDIDEQTTLESHLYHLGREDEAFLTYRELRAKVKVMERRIGRVDQFREKTYDVASLAAMTVQEKEEKGIIVRELVLSKLALFAFTV